MTNVLPIGGSVYSTQPSVTPKYAHKSANRSTYGQARIGVRGIDDPRLTLPQSLDRYTEALAGVGYIDFLLQSVAEPFSELYQVSEVLSDAFVPWFFGQHAPLFSYSGVLLNSEEDDWRSEWHLLYNEVFRGSRLADRGLVVTLQYDTFLVEGAMTSLVQTMNAHDETQIQFNFQMLVMRFLDLAPAAYPTNIAAANRSYEALVTELVADDVDTAARETTIQIETGQATMDQLEALRNTGVPVPSTDAANAGW